VYPAAGLVNYFTGNDLVIINKDATGEDFRASLLIQDSIGKVFGALKI
jgi:NAD-dependent deacetylase